MGCFGAICAISGFPIEKGDPVRFMLLTQSPFEDGVPVGMNHFWAPRTYPLRGKYNDYGGVDHVETGPQQDVWLEALTHDTVPIGTGNNQVHDVAVSKNMTWDELQTALRERRLHVRSHVDDLSCGEVDRLSAEVEALLEGIGQKLVLPKKVKPPIPQGIPTRVRVERLIQSLGFMLGGSGQQAISGDGGFLVDKRRFGEIRVRFESWNRGNFGKEESFLAKILPGISAVYAAMISEGFGSRGPEILVRPKPGTKDWSGHRGEKNRGLLVTQVMIREDVWQALLAISSGGPSIRAVYARIDHGDDDFNVGDALPFVLGPSSHWYLMGKKGPRPKDFLRTAAEFKHVYRLLSKLDYYWRPTIDGHQETSWKKHSELMEALTAIARKRATGRKS